MSEKERGIILKSLRTIYLRMQRDVDKDQISTPATTKGCLKKLAWEQFTSFSHEQASHLSEVSEERPSLGLLLWWFSSGFCSCSGERDPRSGDRDRLALFSARPLAWLRDRLRWSLRLRLRWERRCDPLRLLECERLNTITHQIRHMTTAQQYLIE